MSWWSYVESVARTSRQRDISDRTGIDATNLTRWKSGHVPKPEFVATFARSYGRPVLEAFIAAGFLTPEEASATPATPPDYSQLTNKQLLELVEQRMVSEREEGEGDADSTAAKMQARGSRVKGTVVRKDQQVTLGATQDQAQRSGPQQ